jgi:hypothetical protein
MAARQKTEVSKQAVGGREEGCMQPERRRAARAPGAGAAAPHARPVQLPCSIWALVRPIRAPADALYQYMNICIHVKTHKPRPRAPDKVGVRLGPLFGAPAGGGHRRVLIKALKVLRRGPDWGRGGVGGAARGLHFDWRRNDGRSALPRSQPTPPIPHSTPQGSQPPHLRVQIVVDARHVGRL